MKSTEIKTHEAALYISITASAILIIVTLLMGLNYITANGAIPDIMLLSLIPMVVLTIFTYITDRKRTVDA